MSQRHVTTHTGSSALNLDTLPPEVFNSILSHLIHPRSRAPGLTEAQSHHSVSNQAKLAIKLQEDLTQPTSIEPWACDVFKVGFTPHPFNALAATSSRCHTVVESYCRHLVKLNNRFNLPFARLDAHGPASVYPDLRHIVYRRLWLQYAPRLCVYCAATIDSYPFPKLKRLVSTCLHCFDRHVLEMDEIERQYHIPAQTIIDSPQIRGVRQSVWYLRTDVEAMALQLYGTRAFHAAHAEQLGKPCAICAITRFRPKQALTKPRVVQKKRKRSRQ